MIDEIANLPKCVEKRSHPYFRGGTVFWNRMKIHPNTCALVTNGVHVIQAAWSADQIGDAIR